MKQKLIEIDDEISNDLLQDFQRKVTHLHSEYLKAVQEVKAIQAKMDNYLYLIKQLSVDNTKYTRKFKLPSGKDIIIPEEMPRSDQAMTIAQYAHIIFNSAMTVANLSDWFIQNDNEFKNEDIKEVRAKIGQMLSRMALNGKLVKFEIPSERELRYIHPLWIEKNQIIPSLKQFTIGLVPLDKDREE